MRKLFVSALTIMAFHISVNAQLSKGSVFLGGSLNYTSQEIEGDAKSSSNNLILNPELTFMLNNRLAFGVGVSVLNSTQTEQQSIPTIYGYINQDMKTKNKMTSPSIFIKTFHPISSKLYWSLRAEAGLGWGSITYEYIAEQESKYKIYGFELSPELSYLLTPRTGLKVNFNGLSYIHTYSNDDHDSYMDNLSFDLNPSNWSFGFFVKL